MIDTADLDSVTQVVEAVKAAFAAGAESVSLRVCWAYDPYEVGIHDPDPEEITPRNLEEALSDAGFAFHAGPESESHGLQVYLECLATVTQRG